MMKILGVLALAATFSAVPTTAMAIPITGSIGFTGTIQDVVNWQTVQSIMFVSAETECPGVTCTGTYAAVADAVPVTFASPFNFGAGPFPINNLWSFGTFAFDLASVTSIVRSGTTESGGIVITGNGTLRAAGLDNTPGVFSFSANSTLTEFRFGATNEAIPQVPDGGSTLGLLGLGLLGLSSLRRKFGI
jgi:hypothetical protein